MSDLTQTGTTATAAASHHFLVMGRAGLDLYPEPAGCSIEEAVSYRSALGGSSANISAALVRQGCNASLVTCVSDDAVGRYCLKQLDYYGINRQHVRSVAGEYRNSLALSESRLDAHQTVIYRNGAADFQMSMDDVENIDYSQYTALITTGTVLAAEPSRSAAMLALQKANEAGIPCIFDIDYRPYSWASAEEAAQVYSKAAALCQVVIGNDTEYGFMAGGYDKGLAKAQALLEEQSQALGNVDRVKANAGHSKAGPASADLSDADPLNTSQLSDDNPGYVFDCAQPGFMVYKMGEKGAVTFAPHEEIHTRVFAVDALKPVGAGDSFMGGLLASLAGGHSLKQALVRGSACAAMVVTRVGCAPAMPTVAELNAFLEEHTIGNT